MSKPSLSKYLIAKSVVIISLVFGSCANEYENDGAEVRWHTWNEGSGHSYRQVDADPKTFEELTDGYGRDRLHVFFHGDIISGTNSKAFRVLGKMYAADNSHVYLSGELVKGGDPATFKVHTRYLAEDKNDYYWKGTALNVSDKPTFELLGDNDDWQTRWAKDKSNGYFLSGNVIPYIDYKTFHPVEADIPQQSGCYAADKNKVYFMGDIVAGADPATFREVDFYIGQDKHRVYTEAKPTQLKDYSKLKKVGRLMYTDGVHVYDADFIILPEADASTFRHIADNWYKDKNHVWWNKTLISEADASTFKPVTVSSFYSGKKEALTGDFNYGKDNRHVFFQDSIIQDADPESFEKIDFPDGDSWTVFDKNRIYHGKSSPKLKEYLNEKYGNTTI